MKTIKQQQRQSGIAMVEVIVAMFVTAFGLMSILSLQIATLGNVVGSNHRYMATILAYDMAERVKANFPNRDSYNGDTSIASNFACQSDDEACLLDTDLWRNRIEETYPAGLGIVTVFTKNISGGSFPYVRVVVQWEEKLTESWQAADATNLDIRDLSESSFVLEVPLK